MTNETEKPKAGVNSFPHDEAWIKKRFEEGVLDELAAIYLRQYAELIVGRELGRVNGRALAAMREVVSRICPDYPLTAEAKVYECIWAIESTIAGIKSANADCHSFIHYLGARLGLNDQKLYAEFLKNSYRELHKRQSE